MQNVPARNSQQDPLNKSKQSQAASGSVKLKKSEIEFSQKGQNHGDGEMPIIQGSSEHKQRSAVVSRESVRELARNTSSIQAIPGEEKGDKTSAYH